LRLSATRSSPLLSAVSLPLGASPRQEPGEPGRFGQPLATRFDVTAAYRAEGATAAVASVGEADHVLAELQDSMMPVEVGDAELRAGLAEVRELLGAVGGRAREFTRALGCELAAPTASLATASASFAPSDMLLDSAHFHH
jgi:hypothetical protein